MKVALMALLGLAALCLVASVSGLGIVLWHHIRLWTGAASEYDYYPFGPDFLLVPAFLLGLVGGGLVWMASLFKRRRRASARGRRLAE